MGEHVVLISSAEATASEVYARLLDLDLLKRNATEGRRRFITSGGEDRFGELGRRFLGPEFDGVEQRPWQLAVDRLAAS